jgi:hypothetical protein
MAWQVDFFVDEHGHAPVEDYLTSLPVQHRAKLLAKLPEEDIRIAEARMELHGRRMEGKKK